MTTPRVATTLTSAELERLRAVAGVLLPGDESSPAATSLPDFERLLAAATAAIGHEADTLHLCLLKLPANVGWDSMKQFAAEHEVDFELLATVVCGAYFMSGEVLDSIGYPHGARRAPRHDLAADQISSGVLDPVLARPSMVRAVTPS